MDVDCAGPVPAGAVVHGELVAGVEAIAQRPVEVGLPGRYELLAEGVARTTPAPGARC
ncbi:hypothetical protein ACRAWF_25765 [Streptomyces sp. L7]